MSNQKKFGAFAGVFTPSLLTILGVIMYMRLGWVVGHAGLVGVILVIVIAHVISVTTGLSISSIATDKKVGAGGVYYVLSRSLGLPIGGAIGLTLYTGTALSIALYLIGFSESFNAYLGLNTDINGLRIGGSLALLTLAIVAMISTSLALKAQFFILAAIVLSLISIFLGVSPELPKSLHLMASEGSASLEDVFVIFFPAVTGFTAGIAMSGDLEDPKKSIPSGTLWSIAVGFVVYMGLALYLYYSVDAEVLKTDYNILLKLALFAPAVLAGIWGATLSSALGGVLGAPRILQAMSVDNITPFRFARGIGKNNEPRNALILTVIIAEAGILIGELDTIARICSMFYLAAYGFINLSFFLESWASSDFNPTFKVKKWIGLAGFIATFMVMFRLDMLAMFAAFIVIGGIYFWLTKKELALGSGDVWQSVWSSVVKTGLRRMDEKQDHMRNWKPNVLLFSGGTNQRPHLLEFSKELVGNRGIVTNFDLHENEDAKVLFPKHAQSVSDEILRKYGVFGRQIVVKNVFKGIETIATTFGFSGIEPNTILMGWAKNTKDPIWFAQMTQKLIELDYNVLYLDYDERFGFRNYATIDLWWRGVGNNAELMLNISRFLLSSELWRNAHIRIIVVDDHNANKKVIEKKVQWIRDEYRVAASVKVIGNALEKRPIYEIMKVYSSETDLVLVGIPEFAIEEAKNFVSNTTDLVGTIGTTLLLKASSHFEERDIMVSDATLEPTSEPNDSHHQLPQLVSVTDATLAAEIRKIDDFFGDAIKKLIENTMVPIGEKYHGFYQMMLAKLLLFQDVEKGAKQIYERIPDLLQHLQDRLEHIRDSDLPIIGELFREEHNAFVEEIDGVIARLPSKVVLQMDARPASIRFRKIARLRYVSFLDSLRNSYVQFGNSCLEQLFNTKNEIIGKIYSLLELEDFFEIDHDSHNEIELLTQELTGAVADQMVFFENLSGNLEIQLLSLGRVFCNDLVTLSQGGNDQKNLISLNQQQDRKKQKRVYEELRSFPIIWSQNQKVVHTSLETDFKLAQVNMLVSKGLGDMLATLNQEIDGRVKSQFKTNAKAIQALVQEYESGGETKSLGRFNIDEIGFVGVELLLQKLKNQTASISTIISEDVSLMSWALMENFAELQLEGQQPVTLSLPKIVDFIIESKLHGPAQKQLERYLSDLANIHLDHINLVNLLKYSISEAKEEKGTTQLLETFQIKLEEESKLFDAYKLRFLERIRAMAYEVQMELDTRHLVKHSDKWSRYISVSKRKRGIANFSQHVRSKLLETYGAMSSTVAAKRHDSRIAVFESKYDLKSNIELGLDFVRNMLPSKTVLDDLPFYYRQLFQGKHLPVRSEYIGRDRELRQLDRLQHEGRKGVILIAGESSSGKTHFAQYISMAKFKGRVIKIDSIQRRGTIKELEKAIATATGLSGSIEQCFSALRRNATIIIDDVEVWWDRSLEKDALTILIDAMERFYRKHTFIVNGNVHALEALCKQRRLKKVVTSTIMLAPLSKSDLQEIVLERHRVGGLGLVLSGEENQFDGKDFDLLIEKVFAESAGNIGLALQIWLRQITEYSNNMIYLEPQPKLEMLTVNDDYWKWLLYQCLINKHLTKDKLVGMFGDDIDEISNILHELVHAGILDAVGRNTFTLNKIVKPNVEIWLRNNFLLN